MIGDLLKSIFGDKNAKDRKEYWPFVEKANAAWEQVKQYSDDQLRDKTRGFQQQIQEAISTTQNTPVSKPEGSSKFYSPLVMNIAAQEGVSSEELERIEGTGMEGRVTKADIMQYLHHALPTLAK